MAGGLDKLAGPGRHTRRPGAGGLRRVSVAVLVMLVLQYGLGIVLNLYVEVPASVAHAGIFTEIATAPLALTVHAVLGIALIGTAVLAVARAVGVRDRRPAVLATAGLTAIGGAFGAGEVFVRNGQDTASLAMAVLTGVALLCYVGMLALATAAGRQGDGPRSARAPATVPAARPGDRARYPASQTPAAWPASPASPGGTTGSWFVRE